MSAPAPHSTRDNLVIAGYIAAALIVIGSLGPWGTVLGLSVAGTDGDGVITLILAILAAGTVYLTANAAGGKPRFKAHWLTLGFAALVAVIALVDIVDISSGEAVSPGWGIWIVFLAGIALTLIGVQLFLRVRRTAGGHADGPSTIASP